MADCRCITGIVVEEGTTIGQAGLTVQAGTRGQSGFQAIASAQTGVDGRFSIDLSTFIASGKTGTTYVLRLYAGTKELAAHGDTRWTEGSDPRGLVICVTYPTRCADPPPPEPQEPGGGWTTGIHGRVVHVDGTPQGSLAVEARVVGLGGETPLSSTTTDSLGFYAMTGPGSPADVIVKVYATGPRLVGSSHLIYNCPAVVRIDIEVCDDALRGPSEYARINIALDPLLGTTAPSLLTTGGLAWMAGKVKWPLEKVVDWALARRLAVSMSVPAEPLYGLLREGFPRTSDGILSRAPSAVSRALRAAKGANIIATAVDIAAFLAGLATARAASLDDGGMDSLGAILRTSQDLGQATALTDDQIASFCSSYAAWEGTDADFWAQVPGLSYFTTAAVAEAKRLVKLGTIGLCHAPCVTSMLRELGTASASTLATWDVAKWKKVAGDESPYSWSYYVSPLPAGLDGATEAEQRATLAILLRENAQGEYRAETARAALANGTVPGFTSIVGFYSKNPNIDLETGRLSLSNPDIDPSTTTAELDDARLAQRLYRIAPTLDASTAMGILAVRGYTSARDVAVAGKTRFVEDYVAGGGDEDTAREIHQKGSSQAGMSAAVFMQAHPSLSRLALDFVPDDPDVLAAVDDATVPGWADLFGNTASGCECKWCQSIHGPSAYLVDLLQWLDAKLAPTSAPSGAPATARASLSARRPDLELLKLTCDNTERVLPYIDLSLEILEAVVTGGDTTSAAFDSEVETAEQLAAPQHTNPLAYNAAHLGGASVAMQTPFHRALAEVRPYLAHLGLDRTELMRDFGPVAPGVPTTRQIAAEELGISVEAAVVVETHTSSVPAESAYWPLDLTAAPSVRSYRRAAEVTYPDILDLLHARTTNPSGVNQLGVVVIGSDPYDVTAYLIGRGATPSEPLPGQFSGLRQFTRLWRATSWTILELDKVLFALGYTSPSTWGTSAPIEDVGNVHRIGRMTELGPVEIASWYADIDTWEDRDTRDEPTLSWWDQTYLKPSLFAQAETEEVGFPFRLNGPRTDVANTALLLLDYTDKLAAVLGIDEDEVTSLVTLVNADLDQNTTPVPVVTRKNLSLLYRWASLARALKMDPTDAYALAEITGIDPFANAQGAIDLIEEWGELSAAAWTVDELDYVLRHNATDRVAPTDDYLQKALGRIRDALKSAMGSDSGSTTLDTLLDDLGSRVAEELGVDRAVVKELRAEAWTTGTPAMPSGAKARLPAAETVSLAGSGPYAVTVVAGAKFKLTANIGFVQAGVGPVTLQANAAITLELSSASINLATGADVVLPTGTEFKIDGTTPAYQIPASGVATVAVYSPAIIPASTSPGIKLVVNDPVLGEIRGHFPGDAPVTVAEECDVTFASATNVSLPASLVGNDLLRRLVRVAFWDVDTQAVLDANDGDPYADIARYETGDPAGHDGDFAVLQLIHKASLVYAKYSADEDERAAYRGQLASLELLDVTQLALADVTGSIPAYERLKRGVDLFALRARLPGNQPTFAELIAAPTAANIAARTDWDSDTLTTLFDPTWMSATTVDNLTLMLDRMEAIRRAGASAETVASWASRGTLTSINNAVSRSVIAAARSRYATPQAWANVARPLRDPVRKAQRDALVSYLIAQEADDDIEDADDLYELYLIDVSMNPEMLTSRIKQAACSVQLFIHRCLFGLENNGLASTDPSFYDLGDWFNDEDRAEWEWMRTYRIWEAARKVFLYPENWIEPELRDDKTPFFRTLEKELAQGDVDADRSESVLLDYLDRLHEVSSLKVLASYVQQETDADGTIDYLHVFARTRSDPPTYWYRRREDSATWTAWEKIDAGVQGDHLVPVVYNRRLMLFWGEFTQSQSDDENAEVTAWWDVRLAMSEYRDGRWSAKQVSTDPVSLSSTSLQAYSLNLATVSSYGFLSSIDDDNALTVTLYGAIPNQSSAAQYTGFYELATFTLDACTMEIEPSSASATDYERLALEANYWKAPGFRTTVYDEDHNRIDHLSVNLGEADDDGEPAGDFSAVEVLASCHDGTAVVPGQWQDFISQSPFFVSVSNRVYFVEPGLGETTVEVEEQEGTSTAPAMSALVSLRSGTAASEGSSSTLSDDDATTYSRYLDASTYASAEDAIDAIKATDDIWVAVADSEAVTAQSGQYKFSNFYHPHVCRFIKEVRRNGVFGLLDPDPAGTASELFRQALLGDFDFDAEHAPTERVATPYPVEDIDFSEGGAYSQYNWEIFFHLPFYVGSRLADAGRFDDALDWLHCVFDPRTREDAAAASGNDALEKLRWWKVQPFLSAASAPVTDWIAFSGADGDTADQETFERQVAAWREDPFNPHLLARLRAGTYQKAFVMRYLDTLIGWGDQLFTRDTIETINEATQLYVFAKKVLGDRPEELEPAEEVAPQSYADLEGTLDAFGNALVAIENSTFSARGYGTGDAGSASTSGLGYTSYFCVPPNAKLLSYWDTVEDRLFKIRNGMNIAGVVRSLPLFEPPIDPAMLVRAAASGVDIGAAVDSLSTELPHHRFAVLLSRAQALAGNVKALGGALLSALEKRDSEQLAVLRQTHEEALNAAVIDVRERQVEEAKHNKVALKKQKDVVEARKKYYDKLIDGKWLPEESTAADETAWAVRLDASAATIEAINAVLAWIPDISFGPFISGATTGGKTFAGALGAAASAISMGSGALKTEAGRLTTVASYKRRKQEWAFQQKSAVKEMDQVQKQIDAAEIRIEIAKRELANQQLQAKHSTEVREWMERKYTNAELYDWMVSQLATLHFQAYQLALATAKKAQACYQHELGRTDDSFIQPIYWDSLRKGLLAGERLAADLDRMDVSYLEQDAREFELVKHVSLARLDPLALELLKAEGECWFEVPKVWFDADCPGHYFRRIQSVGVSIACVAGPFGTLNAELTLHGHTREDTATDTADDLIWEAGDYSSIVTSVAVNDTGLFNADPKDPRYLPFERRGAISRWQLRLTAQTWKQIDWSSITDVTLHLRYTARDGGATIRGQVEGNLTTALAATNLGFTTNAFMGATTLGAPVVFSAKRDASDAWFEAQDGGASFDLDLDASELPVISGYAYTRVLVLMVFPSVVSSGTPTLQVNGTPASVSGTLADTNRSVLYSTHAVSVTSTTTVSVTITGGSYGFADLDDLVVVLLP